MSTMFIVVSIVPFFYILAKVFNTSVLFGVKDVFFVFLIPLLLFVGVRTYVMLSILFFFILNLYALFISLDDVLLYFLSLREVFFYPVFGILLGAYFAKQGREVNIFYVSLVYMAFTYFYLFFNPVGSFGSTLRLKSMWDSEHEPAIIGGISFLGSLFIIKERKKKVFLLVFSIGLLLFSASRSALVAIFLSVFLIYFRKASFVKIIFLLSIFFIGFISFSMITYSGRSVDHNLSARFEQYDLAIDAILETNFLGLGTDKYGVVSGVVSKNYCLNGNCTTTMDSSLIKYFVNYGFLYFFIFIFIFINTCFIYFKRLNDVSVFLISVVSFGIVVGFFTGKLGAFPLNLFFYSSLGAILSLAVGRRSIKESCP